MVDYRNPTPIVQRTTVTRGPTVSLQICRDPNPNAIQVSIHPNFLPLRTLGPSFRALLKQKGAAITAVVMGDPIANSEYGELKTWK